jgi:hypothetical protein
VDVLIRAIWGFGLFSLVGAATQVISPFTRLPAVTTPTSDQDGGHDFDFFHGTWRHHDRRLHRTPSGSTEWQEFDGTSVVRSLWNGQGMIEEYTAEGPDGPIHAVSLHLYNPRTRQWSLSWANRAQGRLGQPVVGQFRDGRGEFFSLEEDQGRMIYLRLTWTPLSPTEVRFEQAVSRDGGRTWEPNWIMEFTRIATAEAPAPIDPLPAFMTIHDGVYNGAHGFNFLHGRWRIHNRRLRRPLSGSSEWYEFEGSSIERPFWDGLGNLEEYEGRSPDGRIRGLALRLYDPTSRQWSIHWSNSAFGTLDRAMVGEFKDGRGEFYNQDQFEGREILVRFIWTSTAANAARWEQAFSDDGGRTWETNWIMDFTRAAGTGAPVTRVRCCPVVELRQYALHPGQRDSLIALFDREFVESQEATGMQVIAQFRDIDRPDVFTWLRGFPDMPSRAASLNAFYGGPVWSAHRDAANATMVSSDNVRLLRPARPGTGFDLGERAAQGAKPIADGLVVATIYTLNAPAAEGFTDAFERVIVPALVASGARPFAMLETEASPNTFPRLPVREGEHCFVWFTTFADASAYDQWKAALEDSQRWRKVLPVLEQFFREPVEIWRLSPTARSRNIRP